MSLNHKKDPSDPWHHLEAAWQDVARNDPDPTPTADAQAERIARLGRRQRWVHRAIVVGELIITVVFGLWALYWLSIGSIPEKVAGVFVLTVLVVVGRLRWHTWVDRDGIPDPSPSQYVHRLLERNADGRQALTLGKWLLAVEILFFTLWLPWNNDWPPKAEMVPEYAFLIAWTLLFLVIFRISGRYLAGERARLEKSRAALDDASDTGPDPEPA